MKLKDITIGGRYRARVSGAMTIVRVLDLKETSTFGGRCRTTIVAVNEKTKRQITIRSAQRLRPLPSLTPIEQLQRVDDLQPGQRAVPEPGVCYDLRLIDGSPLGLTVKFVTRSGDALLAHADDGLEYPVSGRGAYILCPKPRPTSSLAESTPFPFNAALCGVFCGRRTLPPALALVKPT